jgi:hypothetical protein
MTTRKSKSKSKSKGNSHRNGRTKRGGFLAELFNPSFSWFGNNPKPNETSETTEPAPSEEKFDWSFGLRDKLKPPTIPLGNPGLPNPPGRPPVTQQPQQAAAAAPQAAAAAAQAAPAAAVPVTTVKGGRRLRVRTKKRRCRCKRN